MPVEWKIQRNIMLKAQARLHQVNPIVIGITGSYGKTSVKHILNNILSTVDGVLMTPGSVNTLMGIARTILEELTPDHKYFIVEMGAYGRGSVRKLCDFVGPRHGIITTIGTAHLERFRTHENILKTKLELAVAVGRRGGHLAINSDSVPSDQVQKDLNCLWFGTRDQGLENEIIYENGTVNKTGIVFKIRERTDDFIVTAPIYGLHHVMNIAAAYALARSLEIPAKIIIDSLKNLQQIRHRSEVLRPSGGAVIIDNAYSSNISGFVESLNLLATLGTTSGKKYLVTPGIVELGHTHDEAHEKLGQKAGTIADCVLVICHHRIPSFVRGFNKTAQQTSQLMTFPTFMEAKKWLDIRTNQKDVVLFENDLPDLNESRVLL
jgi:UDP-N-acetylmuramoyl-tripeptide--D-alanyl-D-alanine ligase